MIFRLKVPQCSSCSDTAWVAKLQVLSFAGAESTILAEPLLRYGDFRQKGQYEPCSLTFYLHSNLPGTSLNLNPKDYRVYWYKNTDLYIDNLEVYDEFYDSLFFIPSSHDSSMTVYEYELRNDPNVQTIQSGGYQSLYRWYNLDQPEYDQFRSSKKVNEILQDKNWAPGIQAYCRQPYRYLDELAPYPQELVYDDYPIYSLPENDSIQLQIKLDAFAQRLWKVNDAAKLKNKEWWYIAQTYDDTCSPPKICRYPHNSELKATVYMALAYGAKGIGYYRYYSWMNQNGDTVQGGIVDTAGGPVQTYPYNDYYAGSTEYLFDAVKDINQKLDTLGPILKKLDWKWAGPADSARYAPGSFVLSVDGVACTYCGQECKWPPYENHIQVGMFKDDSLAEDYLMLVNRRVGYLEKPCEEVSLQNLYPRYYYLIDCLKNTIIDTVLGPDDVFHIILDPGEGRLFRFANFLPPTNLYGSVVGSPQRIRIQWTDPDMNLTGFKIERKSDLQPDWAPLVSIDSNVTSYYDNNNLLGSETYYYQVRAFDQWYNSEYSNQATVKNIPNPPRNLTAHLNRICCPGRGYGAGGSGIGINGICPYCYTNEIILSWQAPQNQKSGTLTQYKITASGPGLPGGGQSQTVPDEYTSMTFCVPELGQSYSLTVRAIDTAGNQSNFSNTVNITSGTTDNCIGGGGDPANKMVASVTPMKFELFQNYPNPFNFGTLIKYALPEESEVKIVIYNLLGQKVRVLVEDLQEPGYYTISWDGKNEQGSTVGSGIYFYRIQAGSFCKTAKMSLLK
jgi:hypothetical protein